MTMTEEIKAKSRKERRKEERLAKKKRRRGGAVEERHDEGAPATTTAKRRAKTKPNKAAVEKTPPKHIESKTNSSAAANNKRPKPSLALDKKTSNKKKKNTAAATDQDPYAHLDPELAAAMRRDDEEIAALEAQLLASGSGGSNSKSKEASKSRLHREYAKLEGFGDDFGDFLDGLDTLVRRVGTGGDDDDDDDDDYESDDYRGEHETHMAGFSLLDDVDTDDGDDVVPMKDPAFDSLEDDDSVLDEMEAEALNNKNASPKESRKFHEDHHHESEQESSASASSDSDDSDHDGSIDEADDHDRNVTYRPTKGEDIYGNKIAESGRVVQPKKYVPPHLRNREAAPNDCNSNDATTSADQTQQQQTEESMRHITRSLNSALNRLSEDTLLPVAQSLSQLYTSHPTADVNACLWKNMQNACVDLGHVMTGLIPVYVAAMVGAHLLRGDGAQLGESLMEHVVVALMKELEAARSKQQEEENDSSDDDDDDDDDEGADDAEVSMVSKEACNEVLILCYLYNFGIVHCSLLYDIIRNMIKSFHEIDIELLLLILSHCGRTLRSDDPLALKDIVLLVQNTHLEKSQSTTSSSSSRGDFMVAAMLDLKNNKRRKQDEAIADKTGKLRKSLGHIKSSLVSSRTKGVRSSDSSLRISLQDILNIETKGRWWKVGASWVGNQHGVASESSDANKVQPKPSKDTEFDEKMLKLAAKYRMNTDVRRSIFCIIMGSADYEDCFEKLVRAGMLKSRCERDTVRVLMECCGKEKTYNKFYSHLAQRMCEYQMQCKFSFQLAFWDSFKQFDEMKPRKAANLAKLLFHLVAVANCLKLNVLKAIDLATPEDMSETATIFTTIFLSSILEHYDDPGDVFRLFEGGLAGRKKKASAGDETIGNMDESDALQASLTVFLVQVMKASPKYKKGSRYRRNLKAAIKACDTDEFF